MRYGKQLLSASDSEDVCAREDLDVVIVGNGPSSIILSFLLSGHWPYYNGKAVVDPVLNERLKYITRTQSVVLQDLEWLSEGLHDSRTLNPVSILFDQLLRPNADMLTDEDSVIEWKYSPENEVPHLVVGLGEAGGSWHHMKKTQATVSLVKWLEMPGYSFREWFDENEKKTSSLASKEPLEHVPGVHPERTNALLVGLYYADYVRQMGLATNFINNIRVTNVCQLGGKSSKWVIEGSRYVSGSAADVEPVSIKTNNVVLACGVSKIPRQLNIPGEQYSFVHHKLLDSDVLRTDQRPVLVVGCGLVALDTVLSLMADNVQVIHAFRRSAKDPQLIVNQLSSAYADYLKLKPLMRNEASNEYYLPLPEHALVEILPNKNVVIEYVNSKLRFKMPVSDVIINIGSMPDLTFISGSNELREEPSEEFHIKNNPLDIDLHTHESRHRSRLYAVGPLVGDNFVRFIPGGALAVTHGLLRHARDAHVD